MKKILITGASRGIGFELAKNFCSEGHEVIALARSQKGLDMLHKYCKQFNGILYPFPFDLSKDDYANKLLPFVRNTLGNLDVLINNAGLLIAKDFSDFSENDFDRIFSVNVKSVFKTVQTLLPLLNRDSHIVNISSMGGFMGSAKFRGLSLYSAAKGAVSILTESLAEELKEQGIRVNALALGAVQTEMLSEAFPDYKAPLSATETASFIAGFALTGNRYFNGKVLPVSSTTP